MTEISEIAPLERVLHELERIRHEIDLLEDFVAAALDDGGPADRPVVDRLERPETKKN